MSRAYKPGDVEIVKIDLHLHTGEVVGLTGSMVDLQLYEDVFAHCIRGSVSLSDRFDLIANGPIVGNEMIDVELRSMSLPSENDVVRYRGIVYRLSDRLSIDQEASLYVLHFTSPEMIVNETKKISKYFTGAVGDIVTKLYRDAAYLGTERAVSVEAPQQSLTITTPYWSPFKIIDWFARSSLRAGSRTPDYVSFETLNRGYQFISLSTLISGSDPVTTLYYTKFGKAMIDPADLQRGHAAVDNLYINNVFDILERARTGVYASRMMLANTLTKSLTVKSIDMANQYNGMPILNQHKPLPSSLAVTKNSHMYSVINQEYAYDGQKSLKFEDWVLQRVQRLQSLNNVFRVDLDIAGRFDIGAGRKVNLQIEQNREATSENNYDPYYSGNYLITAVAHYIQAGGKHTMSMQCVTDSLSKALP